MLNVDQPIINLGTLKLEEPHIFQYTVTNMSNKPVKIKGLSVGCGSCTVAYMSKHIINPNDSDIIHVTFTPNSTGLNHKNVTLSYFESEEESTKMSFKAEVIEKV